MTTDIADLIAGIPREKQINFENGISEEQRERYRAIQTKLAYYRGQKVKLEGYKKIVTARMHKEAYFQGMKSQHDQKVYAEGHDNVLEIVNLLSDVEINISLLWAELDLFNKDIEVWRTKQASLRHEQKSY